MTKRMFRNSIAFLIVIAFIFGCIASAMAGTLELSWKPNQESDLAGYKLYYTEEGTANEQSVDVGNVTTYELTGLTTGAYYLIEATAYDTSSNESERSYGVRGKAKYSVVEGLEIIG